MFQQFGPALQDPQVQAMLQQFMAQQQGEPSPEQMAEPA